MFTAGSKNTMLNAFAATVSHLSLHSAYHATGGNELAGATYARQPTGWSAASGGSVAINAAATFPVDAGASPAFIGFWSALSAGTFYGMVPTAGGDPRPFYAANAGDLFTSDAHGFSNNDRVVFWDVGNGAVLPTGITEGTVYFVIGVSGDTFQVSATSGGSAVVISSDGGGLVQKLIVETFSGDGQYEVTTLALSLAGA